MKILVTGAKGFIGRNLIAHLEQLGQEITILPYDIDTPQELFTDYTACCDFVYHLAGVNRPLDTKDYMKDNADFTQVLLSTLEQQGNKAPVLVTSSIQAALNNPYGKSKKAMEKLVLAGNRDGERQIYLYRLPNVFGKWCRPNYNSVVATFCHQIARGLPVVVNDRDTIMQLVYIDDVVKEFIGALAGTVTRENGFCTIKHIYTEKLGRIADLLEQFSGNQENLQLPKMSDPFTKKLYSTYLSYLPKDQFSYPLTMHTDARGSFTEFFRTSDSGQVSVNVAKPGVIKGNHWHHTKTEKFLIVSGEGVIRLRKIDEEEMVEYHLDSEHLKSIDIPPGYIHQIENTGEIDLVTLIWCNECFDSDNPDTYSEEV